MDKQKYIQADAIQSEISISERWIAELKYINENHSYVLSVKGYPLWRIDQQGRTVEDFELNKKITELVVAHNEEKLKSLRQQFDAV